jgi:GntR family transcriptional regulator
MPKSGTFHQHLIERLRQLIRSGKFPAGVQFLTEREIAERFETSRPTANKALSSLVTAGLLEVRRGAGTFVRESSLDYDLERLVSFTDKAKAAGKVPGTELIEYRTLKVGEAPQEVMLRLKATPSDPIIYMERTRLADSEPVIFERRYVAAKHCPRMTRRHAKGSLYACWTEKCGLNVTGADETIHAVNASKTEARPLKIAVGTACFKIVATGYVDEKTPLWHEETFYRADVYEFRNRIGGISGTRAAMGTIKD